MEKGLVSIVVPCYNGEKFIDKFFSEILKQTYEFLEIIIVNDGSTDNSEEKILSYKEKIEIKGWNFIYIKQQNGGPGAAMNTGIKRISGEYISWIDIDDYYESDAIKKLVSFLVNNSKFNIVRGKVKFIDYSSNSILFTRGQKDIDKKDLFEDYLFVKGDAYSFSGIWMVRTKHFDKCIKNRSIYPSRFGQGWQLLLPILHGTQCGYVNEFVLNCMIRNDSISHSTKNAKSMIIKNNGYHDILNHVISDLNFSDEQRKKYIRKINKKYKIENIKARFVDEKTKDFFRKIKNNIICKNKYKNGDYNE